MTRSDRKGGGKGRGGGRAEPTRGGWRLLFVLFVFTGSCAPVGVPETPAPEPVPEGAPLREGVRDADEARAAARLLAEGERLLRDEDPEGARDRALEVEERYPEAVGSSHALWLRSRAERVMERWDEAERTIARFLEVVPRDDPLRGEASLLRAKLLHEGELGGEIEALFQVPQGSRRATLEEGARLAEELAGELETPLLRDVVRQAPRHPHILPPFLVELAVREHLAGNDSRARDLAFRALRLSPAPEVAERAGEILDGRVEEAEAVAVVVGALLPESGSPSMQDLARQIREGAEVAVAREGGESGLPVRFLPVDDHGELREASEGMRALERDGVSGVIGPVLEPLLEEVVRARSRPIPVISPTARVVPEGEAGVYSLTASEPGPPRMLARMAWSHGLDNVIILHPSTEEMFAQSWWFRQAYQDLGGVVVRTLSYPPGTTSFEVPLSEVVLLEPDGLILLLPPEDVEAVAPQIAYWGVDDLEIVLLGNESWSSQRVLDAVPPRHTNGVLTVSSRTPGGDYGPGWQEFVQAYEEHFQRGLRSPTPALGYDAARLLIEANRRGDGTPEGTLRALERIRDFPGATGLLSIVDGRIQRTYLPVRIDARRLIPILPEPFPDPR